MRIVHALYEAFYRGALYRAVSETWRGAALGYLLLLAAIAAAGTTWHLHGRASHWVDANLPAVAQQVPTIHFKDGTFVTDTPGEHRITDPENGEVIAIVDTSRDTPPAKLDGASFYLTGKGLFARNKNKNETAQPVPINPEPNATFDSTTVMSYGHKIAGAAMIIAWPFITVGMYVFLGVLALLLSLFGMILAGLLQVRNDYAAKFRIAVVTLTPTAWFVLANDLVGHPLQSGVVPLLVIGAAFSLFAYNSLRGEPDAQPE